MTSNQHYDYDDDSTSHLQHHRPQHHDDNGSSFDPCQAYTNKACIEACQAMSSVNNTMAVCGGGVNNLFSPSNYFGNGSHDDDGDGTCLADHHSHILYNPGGPIGPTTCEYCGNRNTDNCTSNLPEEYMLFMGNTADRGSGSNNGSNPDNNPHMSENNNNNNGNGNNKNNSKNNNSKPNTPNSKNYANSKQNDVCSRPKLFFLKKRPPFATPDGWNPVTQYRTNLFEPPTSMEGMGRGWGEVRGHLGGGGGANGNGNIASNGGGGNGANNNSFSLNRSYANSHCGSSACGGGAAETEISFSSAGEGRGRDVNTTSDGGRSLSPVQWVSGLMGALSPS